MPKKETEEQKQLKILEIFDDIFHKRFDYAIYESEISKKFHFYIFKNFIFIFNNKILNINMH